jgi:hypothetical protein
MGEPGFNLDALARSLATRGGTRRTLMAALAGAAALAPMLIPDAEAKRKKKKKKKRCKFSPTCDGGCCAPEVCFAKEIDLTDRTPLSFACCPPHLLSINPTGTGLPDQCCYDNETPKPELANNGNADMLCCRPCPSANEAEGCFVGEGWLDGCIIQSQYECIDGSCQPSGTARLPRVRR